MRITRKWQLLSIGILAVVLVAFSFPQAVGHTASPFNIQHVLTDIAAVFANVDNVEEDVAAVATDVTAIDINVVDVRDTVDDIEADLQVKKKFYRVSESNHVDLPGVGSDGEQFTISLDCNALDEESCAFTVEGILVRVSGLVAADQSCIVYNIVIDGADNPETTFPLIVLTGDETPFNDSNYLVERGIGPVAAASEVKVYWECINGDVAEFEADFEVTVVGEMPQGASITLFVF